MSFKFPQPHFQHMELLESNGHVNSKGLKENHKSKVCNSNYKSRVTSNISPTSLFCPQQERIDHEQKMLEKINIWPS